MPAIVPFVQPQGAPQRRKSDADPEFAAFLADLEFLKRSRPVAYQTLTELARELADEVGPGRPFTDYLVTEINDPIREI